MTQQRLVKIGDRIIDLNAVKTASYQKQHEYYTETGNEPPCVVSFGWDEHQHFYGAEADLVWKLLSDRAVDITPAGGATA